MNLILLFGPQAVGKMTVGQELQKITDFKLFHNHMTIELLVHSLDFVQKSGSYQINSGKTYLKQQHRVI